MGDQLSTHTNLEVLGLGIPYLESNARILDIIENLTKLPKLGLFYYRENIDKSLLVSILKTVTKMK